MIRLLIASSLAALPAHSWYSQTCCGDTHCHPVPCDQLIEQSDGSYRFEDLRFDKVHVHPSQDRHCHVCNNGQLPLCAYIQQGA